MEIVKNQSFEESEKEQLTLEEVAERFSIPLWTLRTYASQRKFPIVKLGRRIYVNTNEFRQWLNRFRVEPTG